MIGRPSICTKISNPSTGFSSQPRVIINDRTVYVTLSLYTAFIFSSEQEMTSFMQYSIPDGYKPVSGYCRQRPGDLKIFDCLFNYPLGVPRTSFTMQFSYSKDG